MNRAFSALNLLWVASPRALPWVGMKDAFGVIEVLGAGLLDLVQDRLRILPLQAVSLAYLRAKVLVFRPKAWFIPAQGNALGWPSSVCPVAGHRPAS